MLRSQLLIVSDKAPYRTHVRGLVEECTLDADIVETESIAASQSLLLSGDIDCTILDSRVVNESAIDLFAQGRQVRGELGCALVLLTPADTRFPAADVLKLGAGDQICKSHLNANRLRRAIRCAMEEGRRQLSARQTRHGLAFHDGLTGMPNRRLFLDRLEQRIRLADRTGESFALLMLGLDMFKSINDALGYVAGDIVLKTVGERLLKLARRSDTYARIGGDEFSILLSGSIDGAIVVAEKIVAVLAPPIDVGLQQLKIDASIGIAAFPKAGRESNVLLAHADQAMSEAKRSLRHYAIYHGSDINLDYKNAQISMEIAHLPQSDQLRLHYQPKYHLDSGRIVGVEALARWEHPRLGNIPPDKFIPILERSKFMFDFTDAIFHKALGQAASWRRQGHRLKMSVNISPQSLDRVGFVAHVHELLAEYGCATEDLIIEITETASLSSYDRSAKVLLRLAESGVGISIDDFGTGYTSMRYLRDFPVSELKIDKMFISNVAARGRDYAITSGIGRLARGLGATTVAEGIETLATLEALRELGCDYGQGYYLCRPKAAQDISSILSATAIAPDPSEFSERHNEVAAI
ncbi:MAG: diguanylate cyclase (GGDEF)-like protein [Gammaproteobacteria bacterium]|jgi:diguanylate cyclase (GGDEF)-like protein